MRPLITHERTPIPTPPSSSSLHSPRLQPQPFPTDPATSTIVDSYDNQPSESISDYPQEVTWLFFRDNQWVPFQNENHYKIEQAFTFGGIYVDIKDSNFPQLKSIRVFPTRFYLSYLGMKYRLSCVIQG
ncbi:hypothetical protein DM01DRAFT_1330087 [Hesseltinella vesiculosa]|uniref:WWE domain-containing protein n=1 Tax=Hesseltinella vesiculosa TaxID=101127 RepID=A0A1X2G3D8_9FUNG|nr:hypothetical protein DM01DRAFT_1330087 [Hesseltinella vesiculosa]